MLRPAGNDPIFRQLLVRNWRWRLVVLSIALAVVLVPIVLSYFEGLFLNPELEIDCAHDWGYIIQFLILLPFFVLFIPYYLNALEDALVALRERGVVGMTEEEYQNFSVDANRVFSHWVVTACPYAITALVIAFCFGQYWLAGRNTWNCPAEGRPFPVAAILSMIPSVLLYVMVAGFVFRVAAICMVIRRFLQTNVTIHALHPDKAGGLSPLGDFSLRITAAGIVAGFCSLGGFAVNYYQYGYPLLGSSNVLILLSYVVGLAVVFFVPLLSARRGMLDAKRQTLQLISDRFTTSMREAVDHLHGGGRPGRADVSYVEDLGKLYDAANRMPVYPFNTENVVKFFSSVLWPLVLMFAQWLVGKV